MISFYPLGVKYQKEYSAILDAENKEERIQHGYSKDIYIYAIPDFPILVFYLI